MFIDGDQHISSHNTKQTTNNNNNSQTTIHQSAAKQSIMIQYRQQFIDILDNNAVVLQFDNKEDHEACQLVLEDPTIIPRQEELANTSYAYWYLYSATSSDSDSASESQQQRQERHKYNACLKDIRRHFVGEGKELTKTLNAVHEALDYRSKYQINDLIRPCFYQDTNDIDDEDSTAKKKSSLSTKRRRIRRLIQQDLRERQALLIAPSKGSGGDRYGRQIVYKGNRVGFVDSDTEKEADDDDDDDDEFQQGTMSIEDEAWMYAQLYTAERCVAYEEFRSYYHNNNTKRRGQQEEGEEEKKFTVIFDFENYSSKYSPSTSVVTNLTSVLQRCYPERLGTIIILKPPFWMRAFFLILRPFMSKATTDKLNLLTGDDHIDETLHDLVGHDDQLATALATGSIVSSTDWDEYLSAPFCNPYDDVKLS